MKSSSPSHADIERIFGGKIRVRACGVCSKQNAILLLKHQGIGRKGFYWNVPGGSPEEGESLPVCLKREFKEEVGLDIEVHDFLYLNEYIKEPLHAVECYFRVSIKGGKEQLGTDPEMKEMQMLSELRWFSHDELKGLDPSLYPTYIDKLWPA